MSGTMASIDQSSLRLFTYFRSTSTARVRIAANLKKIPLSYVYIDVSRGEQLTHEYAATNPSLSVPTLSFKSRDSTGASREVLVTQSVAILELFEELFPSSLSLLPPAGDSIGRALVRSLVSVITCDVQPPTNQRILKRVSMGGGNADQWAKGIMEAGLRAFEQLVAPHAGRFCYGDTLTLADVVLPPAVVNATRYGVDVSNFLTIDRLNKNLVTLEAFRQGDWKHQDDTPVEFREKESV